MGLYKIRKIMVSSKQDVFGITLPNDLAILRKDIFYQVETSGTSIILSSGCKVTEQLADKIKWGDLCKTEKKS